MQSTKFPRKSQIQNVQEHSLFKIIWESGESEWVKTFDPTTRIVFGKLVKIL